MAFKRKAAGAWVDVAAIKRRAAGAWVTCANVYRRSGGAWVKVWPVSSVVNIVGAFVSAVGAAPAGTQALYSLTSTGLEQTKTGTGALTTINTWLLSGAASLYDVRFTVVSDDGGGTLTGSGAGAWLNLATTRSWSYGNGGIGTTGQLQALVEVRLNSSGVVLDSASVQLDTERV